MDGTTVRHIDPRMLHMLELLDDASQGAARLLSKLFMRRVRLPSFVEARDGKRPRLLVHRAIHKLRRKDVEEIVQPCPGIYAVLETLRARRVPTALVSNGIGRGYGHDVMNAFGLARYFQTTVFREDVCKPKPHPDALLKALDHIGRPVRRDDIVWYVGDQRKDVTAALNASEALGLPVIPIAFGMRAALSIIEHGLGPEHIVATLPDLEAALLELLDGPTEALDQPT